MNTNEFDIYVALPISSLLKDELKALSCKIIELQGSADRSFDILDISECIKIIKDISPDIVHSHGSLSSRISATLLNSPSRIFTRHCTFPLSKHMTSPISKALIGGANTLLSTHIIAVADAARKDLISMGCRDNLIDTVINGVEALPRLSLSERSYIRERYALNDGDFVVSIFARLEEYKGHTTFLEAARICKKYYSSFKFLIVGDGAMMQSLKDMAVRLGISDEVLFLGFCRDVTPIFNITDVNVNCSFGTETSSLALSEGMSLGIPAIASDFGGNTYMVQNGENGLIFPQKNAEALAMALIRLYRDKELYQKCSVGAYRRFRDELNAKTMTEKMMEIYRKEYARAKKSIKMR